MEANLAASEGRGVAPSPFAGAKWAVPTITWSFADSAGPAFAPFSGYIQAQYQSVVEQAVNAWAQVSGLHFQQVADSSNSDMRIGWGNFNTQDTGIIGLTSLEQINGNIESAIVRLENPGQDQLAASGSGSFAYTGTDANLYQTVLHEIGHALGLADTADRNSVMFAELGAGNTALDATDIRNIDALYQAGGSGYMGLQHR
jgi:predicted Zn-dependent protease